MSYEKRTGVVRRFVLYTEPCVADPAWCQPVCELGEPGEYTSFNGTDELEKVVAKLKEDLIRNDERQKATTACLAVFGLTYDDYFARVKQNRAAVENANGRESAPPTTIVRSE